MSGPQDLDLSSRERAAAAGEEAETPPPSSPGTPLWERWGAIARRLALEPVLACFDYDGTLVPIRPTPEQAVADAATLAAVARLAAARSVRVAVVSGRPVEQLFTLIPVPEIWRIGLHGLVTAPPGGTPGSAHDLGACREALAPLRQIAAEIAARHPGVRVEDKGPALALHTRLASREDAVAAGEAFRQAAAQVAGFAVMRGKEVFEARPEGAHKGAAVTRLRRPGETVLYLGDDVTDEDAFRELAADPMAITVRIGEPQPTAARFRIERQEEVGLLVDRLAALR